MHTVTLAKSGDYALAFDLINKNEGFLEALGVDIADAQGIEDFIDVDAMLDGVWSEIAATTPDTTERHARQVRMSRLLGEAIAKHGNESAAYMIDTLAELDEGGAFLRRAK